MVRLLLRCDFELRFIFVVAMHNYTNSAQLVFLLKLLQQLSFLFYVIFASPHWFEVEKHQSCFNMYFSNSCLFGGLFHLFIDRS